MGEIIRMRQELFQRRLQTGSQDNSQSSERNTNESGSHETSESGLAPGQNLDLITLAHQTSLPLAQLEELQRNGILEKVPRNSDGELTSIGTLKHEQNDCQPCLFWIQLSCKKGLLCTYCHLQTHLGDEPKTIRASKSTRDRRKRREQAAKQPLELSDGSVSLPAEAQAEAPAIVTRVERMDRPPGGRSGR